MQASSASAMADVATVKEIQCSGATLAGSAALQSVGPDACGLAQLLWCLACM